jgi:oligopeptide/dipeptide ABC transporter ATP-binding protein
MPKVLEVKNLKAAFTIGKKDYEVIHNLSFHIDKKETLCIVGESGCGKSVTTLCLMDLLPENGKITGGDMILEGKSLLKMSANERRLTKGDKMGMIFQEPMTALNPLLTIGYQIMENITQHDKSINKKEAYRLSVEALKKVDIPEPESRMKQYPFHLSGGLRQRVMIAMALVAKPILLIADEPTTALDVTIQKQVLKLINNLKKEIDAGILFITHDLGVVGEIADRVIVLYSGSKVEEAETHEIFERPLHPYTKGLFNAHPRVDDEDFEMKPIKGSIPLLTEKVTGCSFHPRCPYATDKCKNEEPKIIEPYPNHFVSCFKVEEEYKNE